MKSLILMMVMAVCFVGCDEDTFTEIIEVIPCAFPPGQCPDDDEDERNAEFDLMSEDQQVELTYLQANGLMGEENPEAVDYMIRWGYWEVVEASNPPLQLPEEE